METRRVSAIIGTYDEITHGGCLDADVKPLNQPYGIQANRARSQTRMSPLFTYILPVIALGAGRPTHAEDARMQTMLDLSFGGKGRALARHDHCGWTAGQCSNATSAQ